VILLLLALVAALVPQQAQSRDAATPVGTASISGVVIAAADKQPIGYARVSLNGSDRITYTNAKGEFLFPKLPPGRYIISAQATGYLTAVLGQARFGRPGVAQVLASGDERKGVTLSLHKGGVLAGHVTGPDGRPLAGVSVWALHKSWSQDGMPVFNLRGQATTDDRGEYRIAGLDEGKYLVEVIPPAIFGREGPADRDQSQRLVTEGMIPTFYPGTTDPVSSVSVAIELDAERAGIDFNLQPTPLWVVSGRVEGVVAVPVAARGGQFTSDVSAGAVRMLPASQPPDGVLENRQGLEAFSRVSLDGRFRLEAVPPGQYELLYSRGSGPSTPASNGVTTVTVADRDMEDITIAAHPAPLVAGEIVPASGADKSVKTPAVGFIPIGGERGPYNNFPLAHADTPVTFSMNDLAPGRYALRAAASSPGAYVSKLEIDGAPADGTLIEIGTTDLKSVRVTYNTDLAVLSGNVRHEDLTPVTAYALVIFPVDKREWPVWKTGAGVARPDSSGHYSYSMKPGSYLIAPVEDVATFQWLDPAFLESLIPGATKITLASAQKLTQDFIVK
jgi:hypothetical protein